MVKLERPTQAWAWRFHLCRGVHSWEVLSGGCALPCFSFANGFREDCQDPMALVGVHSGRFFSDGMKRVAMLPEIVTTTVFAVVLASRPVAVIRTV